MKPSGLALELRLNFIDLQGLMAILQQPALLPNGSNRPLFTELIIAPEEFWPETNPKRPRIGRVLA